MALTAMGKAAEKNQMNKDFRLIGLGKEEICKDFPELANAMDALGRQVDLRRIMQTPFPLYPTFGLSKAELSALFAEGDFNMVGPKAMLAGSSLHIRFINYMQELFPEKGYYRCLPGVGDLPALPILSSYFNRIARGLTGDSDLKEKMFAQAFIDLLKATLTGEDIDEAWNETGRFTPKGNLASPSLLPSFRNGRKVYIAVGGRKDIAEELPDAENYGDKLLVYAKDLRTRDILESIPLQRMAALLKEGNLAALYKECHILLTQVQDKRLQPQPKERPTPSRESIFQPSLMKLVVQDQRRLISSFREGIIYAAKDIPEWLVPMRVRIRYTSHMVNYIVNPITRGIHKVIKNKFPRSLKPTDSVQMTGNLEEYSTDEWEWVQFDVEQNDQRMTFHLCIDFINSIYSMFGGEDLAVLAETCALGLPVTGYIPDRVGKRRLTVLHGSKDIFDASGFTFYGSTSGKVMVSMVAQLCNFISVLRILSDIPELAITPQVSVLSDFLNFKHVTLKPMIMGDNLGLLIRKESGLKERIKKMLAENTSNIFGEDERFLGHKVTTDENAKFKVEQSADNALMKFNVPEHSLFHYFRRNAFFGWKLQREVNFAQPAFMEEWEAIVSFFKKEFGADLNEEFRVRGEIQEAALAEEAAELERLMKKYGQEYVMELFLNPEKIHYSHSEADEEIIRLFSTAYTEDLLSSIRSQLQKNKEG